MIIREILDQEKDLFNSVANHPLQSWSWGDFKQANGSQVVRLGAFDGQRLLRTFQITIHTVPHLNWLIGYYPKGGYPDNTEIFAMETVAKKYDLVFIKMEPNVWDKAGQPSDRLTAARDFLLAHNCQKGRAQFTPNTFMLNLTPTEDELFANLKSKTRYNVRLAQKHGVTVSEDNSPEAFEAYINMWKQTIKRQQFYAHDETYQRQMWDYLRQGNIAHLLKAEYQGKILAIWILYIYNNVLYYPYGSSSREHREVMAGNLLAWEAIRLGKQLGCHTFDMWGSLGPNPDKDDPWYGFHKFKEGYGGDLVEFVGTYDYVYNPQRYKMFRIMDRWRWRYLRLRARLPF